MAYAGKGFEVEYLDVKNNPVLLEKMLSHSNGERRVPVIVEGGPVTVGYGGT